MKKRFQIIPAVYLILRRKDGKILLTRRYNTGYSDGLYSMIAGHLDGDEQLTVAMAREAQEEAGITIMPSSLKLVHTMHRKSELKGSNDDERVDFYFTTKDYKGKLQILEPNKCDSMDWFNIDDLPDNIIPCVKFALEQIHSNSQFSEYGW